MPAKQARRAAIVLFAFFISALWQSAAARAERPLPLEYLRAGLMLHDVRGRSAPWRTRENGGDVNLEAGFRLPLPDRFWIPDWHFGGAVNLAGNTHQLYTGFNWRLNLGRDWFVDGALATVMHTGAVRRHRDVNTERSRLLGCRIMFRETLSVGLRLTPRSSWVSSVWHISNANLCRNNQGLTGFGFQYQHNF